MYRFANSCPGGQDSRCMRSMTGPGRNWFPKRFLRAICLGAKHDANRVAWSRSWLNLSGSELVIGGFNVYTSRTSSGFQKLKGCSSRLMAWSIEWNPLFWEISIYQFSYWHITLLVSRRRRDIPSSICHLKRILQYNLKATLMEEELLHNNAVIPDAPPPAPPPQRAGDSSNLPPPPSPAVKWWARPRPVVGAHQHHGKVPDVEHPSIQVHACWGVAIVQYQLCTWILPCDPIKTTSAKWGVHIFSKNTEYAHVSNM